MRLWHKDLVPFTRKKYDCGGISKEEWETIENEFGGYL